MSVTRGQAQESSSLSLFRCAHFSLREVPVSADKHLKSLDQWGEKKGTPHITLEVCLKRIELKL